MILSLNIWDYNRIAYALLSLSPLQAPYSLNPLFSLSKSLALLKLAIISYVRNSLPQKIALQLVIQYQLLNPENIQKCNIMQTEWVVFTGQIAITWDWYQHSLICFISFCFSLKIMWTKMLSNMGFLPSSPLSLIFCSVFTVIIFIWRLCKPSHLQTCTVFSIPPLSFYSTFALLFFHIFSRIHHYAWTLSLLNSIT